ncbi:hypothetical protein CMEL01_14610 [Colletotrichum melonis]|uniref:Uncharacterized protein n=1 Tax=Colletotrichum melonis TaxID=1209925 RepID=A0AAI9XVH7_9PEZI|nr:hypothetical protein CMEL01_14610 [Colletotrichum melonis]
MKLLTLVIALTAPLTAHAWTGHVYSTQEDCIVGCPAKCQSGGGAYDGCSGGGGAIAQDFVYCNCK